MLFRSSDDSGKELISKQDEFIEEIKAQTETAEAAEALLAFGYTQAEIQPVLKRAKAKCKTVEEMIKFSLREFGGGK